MDAPTNFRDVLRRSPSSLRGELSPVVADKQLRILFVTSAHNSLSQRAYIALTEMGHDVTVAGRRLAASHRERPSMRTSPTWSCARCSSSSSPSRCGASTPASSSIPVPHGDRGPSSLDWAIELGMERVGRDRARGRRGGRRRRHLGDPQVPDARRSARAASTGTRCAAPRSRCWSSRSTTSRAGTSSRCRSTTTTRT